MAENSTNVRPFRLILARAGLRSLHALSSELATRTAMDRFTRPRGRRGDLASRAPFTAESRFTLDTGSHRLAAWAWGDGPLVLLLHGWNGRAAQMGSFVQPLVEAGFAVLAVDAPAHGASPGRRTNMFEWSAMLSAIGRRFLGLHGVIAHSAGCVATAHALHLGLRAERVVFLSPPRAMAAYSGQMLASLGLPSHLNDEMWARWESSLGIRRGDFDPLAGADTQRAPLLTIHDPDDLEAPFATSERLAQTWPGARLLVTEGLGHSRIRRAPAVLAAATAFLRRTQAAPAARQPDAALAALER